MSCCPVEAASAGAGVTRGRGEPPAHFHLKKRERGRPDRRDYRRKPWICVLEPTDPFGAQFTAAQNDSLNFEAYFHLNKWRARVTECFRVDQDSDLFQRSNPSPGDRRPFHRGLKRYPPPRNYLQISPCYQRPTDGLDLRSRNRAVAPTIETIGNTIGENEVFIRSEPTFLSPDRKRSAHAIGVWRHRRDRMTVDDEPRSGGIDPIPWTGGDGFEDIPVGAVLAGPVLNIMLCALRNAKINDLAHCGLDRGSHVQARRHARRSIDDDDALAKVNWKDRPQPHQTNGNLQPPTRPHATRRNGKYDRMVQVRHGIVLPTIESESAGWRRI